MNYQGFQSLPITDHLGVEVFDPEPEFEFKIHCFEFRSNLHVGPANVEEWIKGIEERNARIEALLNDGWVIEEKIICAPNVMLILSREKETKENDANG